MFNKSVLTLINVIVVGVSKPEYLHIKHNYHQKNILRLHYKKKHIWEINKNKLPPAHMLESKVSKQIYIHEKQF